MRLPSANRECASCHVMWLSDFKRDDVSTLIPFEPRPVMNTGKQDIASSEPICFSCHDGFVLDSRFLWEKDKHAHPVGQKPSDKIKIPMVEGKNLFPLNDEGRVYCGTCHTAHGVEWGQKETAVFMRVKNENGQLCMACHKDKIKGTEHGMHPLKRKIQKLLTQPPKQLMEAGARFAEGGEVVCQSCHKAHAAPEEKILLLKNDKSQLCGACHINRYAWNRKQAGQLGTHPVNIKPQHAEIPDAMISQGAKLGSGGEVICQTCHRPHAALPETRLLVTKNDKGSLCQSCHKDQLTVLNSKHDMGLARENSRNIRKEKVANAGACSACHVPHKGTGPKMWARPVDKSQDPMASLCLSCHKSDGLAEKHTVGKYSHPVGADISRLEHPVELPAFSSEGVKTVKQMQGKVNCASCHDAHQWNSVDADDKGELDEEGNNRTRFLRIANGSRALLCKACHDEKWEVTGTKHDMRFMAPKSENSLGQTIIESGICGSCHLVHNANGPKLWARSDLHGQGTGYVACLGCHNKKGLAKNKTLGKHSHPMGVEIEKLGIHVQSGNWIDNVLKPDSSGHQGKTEAIQSLPLYDPLGKRVYTDGGVGCGTCHDPHNWSVLDYKLPDQPKNMEGDSNSSFLRIADQGKNNLCVNCHQDKKPIYESRHDLTNRPDDAIDAIIDSSITDAQQNKVPGPCLHCHKPHDAKPTALWARQEGEGKTPVARLCTSCHKADGLAKNKLAVGHGHPVGQTMKKLQFNPDFPVFDNKGHRTSDAGRMDCATCHNPHQWDPLKVENKGKPIVNRNKTTENKAMPLVYKDGSPANSFLRLPADNKSMLCISCHQDKKFIIGTDHDLSVTADNEVNKLGQKRDVSGVCGQCHVPHNASANLYLWAKPLGKGDDQIEKRCRSCHDVGKLAANKNPKAAKHPQTVNIWSTELREQIHLHAMPNTLVYDTTGRKTKFGSLTCASCHNPHQWNATDAKEGSGENEEGNVKNSFLRADKMTGMVCIDCHGKDALFRYKYFHSESAHKKHHMF